MSTSDSWTGKGRTSAWFNRHNWTAGVPGAQSNVAFDDGATWTVSLAAPHGRPARTLSLAISADTLTLAGGRLALGAHAVAPDLTVDNAGALIIAAGASLTSHEDAVIGSLDQQTGATTTGAITIGGTLATTSLHDITGAMEVQLGGVLEVSNTLTLTAYEDTLWEPPPLAGTLDINGTVTSGTITGIGSITLSGPAATLSTGLLQTDGELLVSHGASAAIALVQLGTVYSVHFGIALVDGAGSALTAGMIANNGNDSNAALTVQNGGQVTATAIAFSTVNTDDILTITGTGSSVDTGTLAVGQIGGASSVSVTEGGSLAVGAGGITLDLSPLLLDATAQVTTPFIDSLGGTIAAASGAGGVVTIGLPVMLGLQSPTEYGISVFMSGDGSALDVTGAVTGATGTTLRTMGQVILANGANSLPAIAIESGTLTLAAVGAAGNAGIDFANNGGAACILHYDPDASLHNILSGFGAGDSIDLQGFAFGQDFQEGLSHGTLTLSDAAGVVSLVFAGSYALKDFLVSGDAHGGTLIRFRG